MRALKSSTVSPSVIAANIERRIDVTFLGNSDFRSSRERLSLADSLDQSFLDRFLCELSYESFNDEFFVDTLRWDVLEVKID